MTPDHKSMQTQLFEHISNQFKNKSKEIEALSTFLPLSRSAIYERRSGKTPLSFDEGMALARHFKFPIAELCPEIRGEDGFALPTSLETTPIEYLTYLYRDLKKLYEAGNGYIWCKTDDIPIFWLKQSRWLAAFKLYYWYRALSGYQGMTTPVFNEKWIESPEIQHHLDLSRQCRDIFEEIPSTEIWSATMFDKILAQIEDCVSSRNIPNKKILKHLLEQLRQVKDTMKTMARHRKKGNRQKSAVLAVYQNSTFSSSNLLLGKSKDTNFVYADSGFPNFHRITDDFGTENYQYRFELMLSHLSLLPTHNIDFFDCFDDKFCQLNERLQRFHPIFFEAAA